MDDGLAELDAATVQVTEASAALDAARQRRDRALRAAYAAGESIGHLAERAGLTQARVGQILGHPRGRVGRPSRSTARP